MARRRRIGTATLSIAGAITGGIVGARPAPADADEITTLQHNICGNACGPDGSANLGKVSPIEAFIDELNLVPRHIGINEACGSLQDPLSQRGHVKSFLRARSSMYWGASHTQLIFSGICNTSAPGVPFGVASYVLSSDNPYEDPNRVKSGAFNYQVEDDEARGWACINGGVNTPKYWGCTAHMNNTNPGSGVTGAPAERQFEEYYNDVVLERARAKTTYWGGDMYVFVNEIPQLVGEAFYNANREADLCQVGDDGFRWTLRNKNSGVLSKFDYTFRSFDPERFCDTDALLAPASEGDMYPVGDFGSDHRIVAGYQPDP